MAVQRATLAVIARRRDDRLQIAARLTPEYAVREFEPEEAASSGALLDTHAALALLDAEDDDRTLDALAGLRELPAGRSLILLVQGLADERCQAAIERLAPRAMLPHPCPAPALKLALRQALPLGQAGEGAVQGQRRAPALLGVSASIRELLDQVKRIAGSRMSVLILGETGTGKELVARAIHAASPRARGPCVAVNCGALPDALLESELFGHVRGAFTGASHDKRGMFDAAHGGTLFLDEIGDTSPAMQTKLLRAIEAREIRPVGSTEVRTVDVRIVSATHRDLEEQVARGEFRQDLYYRLNTVTLTVPPLRRRRVDIPFLAQHFAEEFGEVMARRITLDESFFDALARHDFPGNVRELRNAVERAIALATPGEAVSGRHLALAGDAGSLAIPLTGNLRERLEQVEAEAIRVALERAGGNRTQAAKALGLSRLGLRQKLRRLGLDAPKAPPRGERAPELSEAS